MTRYKLTLSFKITAVFTILIFLSVLIFSSLMLFFTKNSLEQQRTKELIHFLNLIEIGHINFLQDGISFPSHAIPYYILYRISWQDGSLIRTNDALIPALPDTPKDKSDIAFRKGFFIDGDLNLVYVAKTVEYPPPNQQVAGSPAGGSQTYRIQAAVDLYQDNASLLLQELPKAFLLYSIPLLMISNLIAYLASRRILRPLKRIILQAQEITSDKLDSRLDETGPKDELQDLAATFNKLFSRLEDDFNRQRRFTSDAAHELKTPLAVISGHVDLLCRWGKENPAVLEESLGTLQKESRSMSNLIENLLQLTRTENSGVVTYPPEKISLRPFLEEIVTDFTLIFQEVAFKIACPQSASISSNKEALRQIIRIFIKNSITYSDRPAFVSVQWREDDGTLAIQDRGWGIPEQDLPRIFQRFYRVDESRNRNAGGTGLGLPIAKALAERLGLVIEVQSIVGQGTTMILKFPH